MTVVDVTITVARDKAVEKARFTVDRVFSEIRAIDGHGPKDAMERVASIAGIARVRRSNSDQLPAMSARAPQ